VTPRAALVSTLNSIVLNRQSEGASSATDPMAGTQHGQLGPTSVSPCPKTHSYKLWMTPYHSSRYMLIDTEWAPLLPQALRSRLEQWSWPFAPLDRCSPHWANPTHTLNSQENWTSSSTISFNNTQPPTYTSQTHYTPNHTSCHNSMPLNTAFCSTCHYSNAYSGILLLVAPQQVCLYDKPQPLHSTNVMYTSSSTTDASTLTRLLVWNSLVRKMVYGVKSWG
jgi:hypothetical protein